jgi:fructose-specific phosphotransferase system IIA component
MRISDHISDQTIKLDLVSKTKDDVIVELVDLILKSNEITNREQILKAVIEREKLCSTGFEHGVAIPHPRQGQPGVVNKLVVALGRSKEGIDFEALDGELVHLFFLLAAPNDQEHLRALARLSRMLKDEDFRAKLMSAKTPADVKKIIEDREGEL